MSDFDKDLDIPGKDIVYRQDAIDTLFKMYCKSDEDGYVWVIRGDACKRIDALPSAQLEDRCSECDAWNKYKNYGYSQWMPVTERLPEEGKQVLVCDDFGEIYIAEYEASFDGRWCEPVEYQYSYDIVAWMPLPKPYKRES